jgi:hypothetical protein
VKWPRWFGRDGDHIGITPDQAMREIVRLRADGHALVAAGKSEWGQEKLQQAQNLEMFLRISIVQSQKEPRS